MFRTNNEYWDDLRSTFCNSCCSTSFAFFCLRLRCWLRHNIVFVGKRCDFVDLAFLFKLLLFVLFWWILGLLNRFLWGNFGFFGSACVDFSKSWEYTRMVFFTSFTFILVRTISRLAIINFFCLSPSLWRFWGSRLSLFIIRLRGSLISLTVRSVRIRNFRCLHVGVFLNFIFITFLVLDYDTSASCLWLISLGALNYKLIVLDDLGNFELSSHVIIELEIDIAFGSIDLNPSIVALLYSH